MEPKSNSLSDREREVAERYAKGETYREIARALFIAPATVRNHLANIYRKTSVNNKLELISALVDTTQGAESRTGPVLHMLDADELPATRGPSLAVMPFAAIGDDADGDLLAYGITEDVHSDLTRFHDLFVAGRSSCVAAGRQSDDVAEIGARLGVQYLVQGTVRSHQNRIRVTAELVDCATGGVTWSELYDRELRSIFNVQSDVADTIAATLSLRIEDVHYERHKDSSPESLSAYECRLRGNRCLDLGGRKNLSDAREYFSRAIEIEPDSAAAYAGLSLCYGYECWDLLADDYAASLQRHRELAEKSVTVDDTESRGHYAMSCTHQLTGQFELADLHAARAVELNPSEYHNTCARGYTLMCLGRLQESVACFSRSLRRNPLAPNSCLLAFGLMEYHECNYGQSIVSLTRLSADHLRRFSCLAAAFAQLGYDEAAATAADEFLILASDRPGAPSAADAAEWPVFWRRIYPFMDEPTFARLREGISKAGLPV